MASSDSIRGLREQIFDNAALLFPDAIRDDRNYGLSHTVKPQEIFSIVMLQKQKPVVDMFGRSQPNPVPGAPLGYQVVVMHGELMNRKVAARGNHMDTVHSALESLLEVLGRSAAAKVFG